MLDLGRIFAAFFFLLLGLVSRNTTMGGGPVHTYRIPSSSMEPTLRCARPAPGCSGKEDDEIIVKPARRALRRGDIVAFRTPPAAVQSCGSGGTFLKRVIGLPGDRLAYDGTVLRVDGKRIREPYVEPKRRGGVSGSWRVPRGGYFVLGDARNDSCDARVWGALPKRNVIGVVVKIVHH